HLARYLPDPNSTVAFVGYQAGGTRGRLLEQGAKEIRIHGLTIPVNARIESLGSLSAHADYSELLRWMGTFKQAPKQTFIVHGEPEAAQAMSEKISASLGWNVKIPEYKEVVTLD
ncbi:MAG: MBL fold metallo-hydrolase RNA specificity domain-containing protein, partial [Blastocatellia bacterium]